MGRTLFRSEQIEDVYLRNDGSDSTSGTLTMAGAVIGSLSGVMKATAGAVAASATVDDLADGATYVRSENNLTDALKTSYDSAVTHISDTGNPHSVTAAQTNAIATALKGANNGVAELDAGGKVPASQLPSSLMDYKGTWAASTNTPTLADGAGDAGDVYVASDAGTVDFGAGNITFAAGDWVIYSGSIWEKSVNSNAVVSVAGKTGVVTLDTDDVTEGANLYFTDARARTAAVADSISDAVTNIAPSQNAVFDALALKQSTTLADGDMLVGNGSNLAAAVTMSGDVTISNAGVAAIGAGVIVDADVNASAAISADKLADGSTNAIPTLTQETNWDTAFGWGDHAAAGYSTAGSLVKTTDILTAGLTAGVNYTVPASQTYFGDTPTASSDKEHSKFLSVYVNGQKQYQGDTGFLRDYKETGTDATGQTTITFEYDLEIGDTVELEISKA